MDTSALGRSTHGEAEAPVRRRGALMKRAAWVLAFVLLALGYDALEPVTNARARMDACVAAYDESRSAAAANPQTGQSAQSSQSAQSAQSGERYDREQRLSETLLACSTQP
jgi:hypothetical protein